MVFAISCERVSRSLTHQRRVRRSTSGTSPYASNANVIAKGAIKRNESRIERSRPIDATEACGQRRAGTNIRAAAEPSATADRNPSCDRRSPGHPEREKIFVAESVRPCGCRCACIAPNAAENTSASADTHLAHLRSEWGDFGTTG